MSISDRLDEIEARTVRAREGRITDRYRLLDVDAPAMLAALRAVLDLHAEFYYDGPNCSQCMYIDGDDVEPEPWPCPTVRAVQAALGEGS